MDVQLNLILSRYVFASDRPFGGLQVILVGDWSQLSCEDEFIFETKSWRDLNLTLVLLYENFRQDSDPEFFEVLEKIRWNKVDDQVREFIRKRKGVPTSTPLVIYSTNPAVDMFNNQIAEKRVHKMYAAKGEFEFFDRLPVPWQLRLFVGCEVIMSCNKWEKSHGVHNGTTGIIIELLDSAVLVEFDRVQSGVASKIRLVVTYSDWEFYSGQNTFVVSALPLKFGYAITAHRVQGLTVTKPIFFNGGDVFGYNLAYTVLSRAKRSDQLFIENITAEALAIDPKVIEFNQMVKDVNDERRSDTYYKIIMERIRKGILPFKD